MCRGLDLVEVHVLDGGAVDFYGRMVVEDDGGLLVAGPSRLFRGRHLHGRFRRSEAVEPTPRGHVSLLPLRARKQQSRLVANGTYFCISPAVPLRPLYSSTTMPNIASESMTRVCVRNLHITRVGGILPFADFHVTPPFGKSIVGEVSRARRRSMLSSEE